jgi:hypothetical protein
MMIISSCSTLNLSYGVCAVVSEINRSLWEGGICSAENLRNPQQITDAY